MDPLIGTTISFLSAKRSHQQDDAPRGGLGSQVLPVAELDEDFEGEPEDGMQYLFLVRREAQTHPRVNRAPNYPITLVDVEKESVNAVEEAEERKKPTEAWRKEFLGKFVALRQRMVIPPIYAPGPQGHSRPPSATASTSTWHLFLFGSLLPSSPPPPTTTNAEPTLAELKLQALSSLSITPSPTYHPSYPPHSPTPILLSKLRHGSLIKILETILETIEEEAPYMPESGLLEWILGVLSRLSEVLDGEDLSVLRRVCRGLRECAEWESGENEDEEDVEEREEKRAMCWMGVVAVAGVWRQEDLWNENLV